MGEIRFMEEVIEMQIDFESTIERERMADLEVIQKIDRGLHGTTETAYVMDKFEELRRMKYDCRN